MCLLVSAHDGLLCLICALWFIYQIVCMIVTEVAVMFWAKTQFIWYENDSDGRVSSSIACFLLSPHHIVPAQTVISNKSIIFHHTFTVLWLFLPSCSLFSDFYQLLKSNTPPTPTPQPLTFLRVSLLVRLLVSVLPATLKSYIQSFCLNCSSHCRLHRNHISEGLVVVGLVRREGFIRVGLIGSDLAAY